MPRYCVFGQDFLRVRANRHFYIDQPQSPVALLDALFGGSIRAADFTPAQERLMRRWCRDQAAMAAGRVEALVAAGHKKKARRAARQMIERRDVQAHALFIAARRRWPTKVGMSPHEAERVRVRRLCRVKEHLAEVGRWTRQAKGWVRLMQKSDGRGYRPIVTFDCVDRARQILLRSALKPFMSFHEGQHMLARVADRRGPAAAREALQNALAQAGEDHVFMHFDVENFYGSISHAWLERHLGIDGMIVRRHVHLGQMNLRPIWSNAIVHARHEASGERGQWGIPQGSALSCLIAEHVMGDVLRSAAVFGEYPVIAWSDNVGVIVPRSKEARVAGLVRAAYADHGAGPFRIGKLTSTPVTQEFKFLGVNYKLADGVVPMAYIARPIVSAWLLSIGDRLMTAGEDEIDEVLRHVRHKKAVWGWWQGWARIEEEVVRNAEAARFALRAFTLQPVAA